jgi:pimeloyl-ACP methyl ester carboxylesterase
MRTTIIPFTAGDGFQCNLIHVEGDRPPTRGPVLLVHGAGVRANIFQAPVETHIVKYLIDAGYDVWLENWRASIDLRPNEWTLDQAALYDHPKAVMKVVEETGSPTIQAIIHCQGSTSFMMSAVAGLVPQVTTIISNAVSLHPIVPPKSLVKGKLAPPVIGLLTRYIDAQWGLDAPGLFPKLLTGYVNLTHRECNNPVCKYSSFIYGTGRPTLWRHENLNDATHEWVKQEFAQCPVSFFRQMRKCLKAGHLVAYEKFIELPDDYLALPPKTDARIVFFAGDQNECFLPESQVRSFNYFNAFRPGYHSLHVIPGYGHLDIFMGHNAVRDVFPKMIAELE